MINIALDFLNLNNFEMIVRIWHGRTRTIDADVYRKYVLEVGISHYISTEGNLGGQIWQRREGDITHIWTVSWWDNLQAVKNFTGEDIEKAKYYEEDKKYLLEFEPTVEHRECFNFSPPK
jgi:heme-degrading monooxygenase HmoA